MRQFILLHLEKLIIAVKNKIEIQLIKGMNKFKFENENENELKNLEQQLKEKEEELLHVNPENFSKDETSSDVLSSGELSQMKDEILNDLKKMNPELERETWIK